MVTKQGPKVLEFNCRMGDPETQAIVMRADFDFVQACMAAAKGDLNGFEAKWSPAASVCVVMASRGYPENAEIGEKISGLDSAGRAKGATVFHAGVRKEGSEYYTNGGRVLGVTKAACDLTSCRSELYAVCRSVKFAGAQFRSDIAVAAKAKTQGFCGG